MIVNLKTNKCTPSLIVLFLLLLAGNLRAQTKTGETNKAEEMPETWRLGLVGTDLFVLHFTGEASYRINFRQEAGLRISKTPHFNELHQDISDVSNSFYGAAFYKLHLLPLHRSNSLYLRSSLRYIYNRVEYPRSKWYRQMRNGNEVFIYDTQRQEDKPRKLGYTLSLGFQLNYENFYMGYYAGGLYQHVINKRKLGRDINYHYDFNRPWYYQGFEVIFGMVVGVSF